MECFDVYFHVEERKKEKKYRLSPLRNWLNLFVDYHNNEVIA